MEKILKDAPLYMMRKAKLPRPPPPPRPPLTKKACFVFIPHKDTMMTISIEAVLKNTFKRSVFRYLWSSVDGALELLC